MKAVLFVAGVSSVVGQSTILECIQIGIANMANCTAALGCRPLQSMCIRNPQAGFCSTDSKTCSGDECKAGSEITDYKTCSTCTDQCGTHTTNATCLAAANDVCQWTTPYCITLPGSPPPCSQTNVSGCAAEPGCWWLTSSHNACGETTTQSRCVPCDHGSNATRSALKNSVDKTCTFAKSGGYDADFTFTPITVEQNAQCGTFSDASADDIQNLGDALFNGILGITEPFASDAVASCKNASKAPTSQAPSSQAPSSQAPTSQAPTASLQTDSATALVPGLVVLALWSVFAS